MTEKKKLFNNDIIFYIAIFLLPFENFCFAPSQGWATLTPVVLALYIVLNFKMFLEKIVKFKKMIIFFTCSIVLTIINYFILGFELINTINALISLGLGFVSLFSFDIYYSKTKNLEKVEKILIISYLIAVFVGIIQFITIKFNIQIFYKFFDAIFKRNYLGLNRVQYFFTEPSFIGMHIFGILLPMYFISKNKKILGIIILFSTTAIIFSSGVRILLDICVVGIILIFGYLARYKKYKIMIIIPLVLIIAFTILYNINYRVRKIANEGIYADGSLATRYFRIQSTVYGYTKNPIHFIIGYGMGNALIPLLEGYDDAIVTYKSSYVSEVLGLAEPGFKDDSVSYCLYIRFISEFGILFFIIASVYLFNITKSSSFKYKYTYLLIILYLYIQFESYAFYSIWMFVLVMLYTANKKDSNKDNNKVLVGYVEDGVSGGIDKYLLNFLNSIDTKKYQIDFITKNYNKKMYELLKEKKCNLFEVSHNRNPIKQYKEMKKIIENGKYGVAYFNISETYNCIGIIAAKLLGVKKIVVHSHSSGSDKESNLKRKIAEILNAICKPIVHICSNQKIACSKKAAQWLYIKSVVKRENYSIVYNAINIEKFKINEEIRNRVRKTNQLEDKFVIGHVGRFAYQKNHEFLLEVFKEVIKEKKNAVLVCIGDGENFETVKKYAKELELIDNIIFTGNVNNVNEYMQAFDIFILPSRFEGLPIVGVEAQLSGLPCLFSKNISEEVLIAKNSKLLDITNIELWKNEILEVKQRKNELLPIAEKYNIEKQKEQFIEIIKVEVEEI